MLIVLATFAIVLLAAFVCGVLIGRTGREALRMELANLRGKHDTLRESYADMKRIAGEAVKLAHKQHFPEPQGQGEIFINDKSVGRAQEVKFDFDHVRPNYLPPQEKHCPECSVSVRAETWPQECPACHCMFGFEE